jgi:hypothetical protein
MLMNRVELTSIITEGPKESKNSRTSRTQDQRATPRQGRGGARTGRSGRAAQEVEDAGAAVVAARATAAQAYGGWWIQGEKQRRMDANKTSTDLSKQCNPLPLVDGLVLEVVGRRHHLSGRGIHGH